MYLSLYIIMFIDTFFLHNFAVIVCYVSLFAFLFPHSCMYVNMQVQAYVGMCFCLIVCERLSALLKLLSVCV